MNMDIPSRNVVIVDPNDKKGHVQAIRNAINSQGLSEKEVELLHMFCLPDEGPQTRIGSQFGSVATAVAGTKAIVTANFPNANTYNDIPVTDVVSFKFSHPLRSSVTSVGLAPADATTYLGTFIMDVTGASDIFPKINPLDYTSGLDIHGDQLYAGFLGESDQFRGFLLSNRQQLSVQVFQPGAADNIALEIYRLDGRIWSLNQNFTLTGLSPAFDFTVGESGYYAIKFSRASYVAADISGNIQITSNGAVGLGGGVAPALGMCWGQRAVPQLTEVKAAVRSFRTNASSLMYTNTSAPLYRQGQTVMRQLPQQSDWLDFIDLNSVRQEKDAATIGAVLGGYVFRKPTSMEEFVMNTPYVPGSLNHDGSGLFEDFAFPLYPHTGILLIGNTVLDANGKNGYWTFCDSIEFETVNQWFDTERFHMPSSSLERVLSCLSALPQFHTNDFHLSDLWSGIKSFASDVWSGVKDVVATVAPYAPLIAPFVMSSKPKGTPVKSPTSTVPLKADVKAPVKVAVPKKAAASVPAKIPIPPKKK